MIDMVAEIEREKYEKVWEHREYGNVSPGEMEKERAFETMGMVPGQTLYDFGSGVGRATKWFCDKGLNAVGIDHAGNANEAAPIVLNACLWDLPEVMEKADWGFCCDVMEHIPEHKVSAVLASIAYKTHRGVWFRISTKDDVFGPKLLGKPLHLTVKSAPWWQGELSKWWMNVEQKDSNPGNCVFHCSN